jgi:subfamily B ATP-binding cassette protein MsbA
MKGIWALRHYLGPHRKYFVLMLIATAGAGAVTAYVVRKIEDILKPLFSLLESTAPVTQEQALAELVVHLAIFFGLLMLSSVFQAGATYLSDHVGQQVLYALRCDVFEHLQSLSMSFFETRRTGELISRINNDTHVLHSVIGAALIPLLRSPVMTLSLIIFMFMFSWKLTMILVVAAPLIALLTQVMGTYRRRYQHQVQRSLAELTSNVDETFALTRVIKVFGLGQAMEQRFAEDAREVYRAEMRGSRIRGANTLLVGIFLGLALTLLFYWGAREILAGVMSAEQLMTFIFMMQMAITEINQFSRASLVAHGASAAAERTLDLLAERPEVEDRPEAIAITSLRGDIEFEDVTFAYESGRPVLEHLNLHISPGEVVALVGPSGAGKTTIAALVPRLYDIEAGAIRVDGHDLRDLTQRSLRSFMGFVPQEALLFAGSIRENIALAKPEASFEEVRAAAQAANAADFIEALPEQYDTAIGERGVKLSGGQKQRIAIARALLRNPRILILDEATSALDRHSEEAVQRALQTLLEGRTALVIAHRLSTVRDADRILVIAEGRIREEGTHDELLEKKGLYWSLYQTRRAAEEEESHDFG